MPFVLHFPFLAGGEKAKIGGIAPQNSKPLESPSAKLSKGLCVKFHPIRGGVGRLGCRKGRNFDRV